jgi:hypothetical protein
MSYWWDGFDTLFVPLLTVFDQEPERTGLLDAQGQPLVRARMPIGFDLSAKPKPERKRTERRNVLTTRK